MKVSLKQTKQRVGASLTSKSSNFPSNLNGGVGVDGATFIPEVSDEGIISWTNNKGLDNPEPKNIRGPAGSAIIANGEKQEVWDVVGYKRNGGEVFNDYTNNTTGTSGFRLLHVWTNFDGDKSGYFMISPYEGEAFEEEFQKLNKLFVSGEEIYCSAHLTYNVNLNGEIFETSSEINDWCKITSIEHIGYDYIINVDKGFDEPHGYWINQGLNGIDYSERPDENTIWFSNHPEIGSIKILAPYAHAEGHNTSALGESSHSEGSGTKAGGAFSHSEGNGTNAVAYASHAEGSFTNAKGQNSHTEGYKTETDAYHTHAEGRETKALAESAHSEGEFTQALAKASHTEGSKTTVTENNLGGHAEGIGTTASFNGATEHEAGSHAEGIRTIASGAYGSHAEGRETQAIGESSHAQGFATTAASRWQSVEGEHNIPDANRQYVHIVGNGYTKTGDLTKQDNAAALDFYGNQFFAGKVYSETVFSKDGTSFKSVGKLLAKQEDVDAINAQLAITSQKAAFAEKQSNAAMGLAEKKPGIIVNEHTASFSGTIVGGKTYNYSFGASSAGSEDAGGCFAHGYQSIAQAWWSAAIGKKLTTSKTQQGQMVVGESNAVDDEAKFIVGVGTDMTGKKNGFVVNQDGSVYIDGAIKANIFTGKKGQILAVGDNGEIITTQIEKGTKITVDGVEQSTWDATGVNVKNDRNYNMVAILRANNQGLGGYAAINPNNPQASTFPVRNANGEIVGNTSDSSGGKVLVNKDYLSDKISNKLDKIPFTEDESGKFVIVAEDGSLIAIDIDKEGEY